MMPSSTATTATTTTETTTTAEQQHPKAADTVWLSGSNSAFGQLRRHQSVEAWELLTHRMNVDLSPSLSYTFYSISFFPISAYILFIIPWLLRLLISLGILLLLLFVFLFFFLLYSYSLELDIFFYFCIFVLFACFSFAVGYGVLASDASWHLKG